MALSALDIETGMESAHQCGENQTLVDRADRSALGRCLRRSSLHDTYLVLAAGLTVLLLGDRLCGCHPLHLCRRILYAWP